MVGFGRRVVVAIGWGSYERGGVERAVRDVGNELQSGAQLSCLCTREIDCQGAVQDRGEKRGCGGQRCEGGLGAGALACWSGFLSRSRLPHLGPISESAGFGPKRRTARRKQLVLRRNEITFCPAACSPSGHYYVTVAIELSDEHRLSASLGDWVLSVVYCQRECTYGVPLSRRAIP